MQSLFRLSLSVAVLVFGLNAQAGRFCNSVSQNLEFCQKMKHLATAVNALDSQNILMRTDSLYMNALAGSVYNTSTRLIEVVPGAMQTHKQPLVEIQRVARELGQQSRDNNWQMLETVNLVGQKCMNCHTSSSPQNGMGWNEMFGYGWSTIVQECSKPGHNPYMCKTMNAIGANYNHIVSASVAKVENHTVTYALAREIQRLIQDLASRGFQHMRPDLVKKANLDAMEVMQLAQQQNPMAFVKARNLNNTCMECHNNVSPQSTNFQKRTVFSW
jgi:hypothetical protein